MKKTKRILSVILAVVLIVTISAIPVSAAEYPWTAYFSGFQRLMPGCRNTYAGYTIPLQTFLSLCNEKWNDDIEDAGGRDGWYGDVTAYYVGVYQGSKHLSSDSVCGPQTWGAIAGDMTATTYPASVILSFKDCYIINAVESTNTTGGEYVDFRYYYYAYGGTYVNSTPFHRANAMV